MFLGHFGAGFAAKAIAPRVSLGWLFAAAQFIDLLWPTLLLAGIERVRIAPGATAVTPLVFEHYPVSHSLAAVLAWAALVGALYFAVKRDRRGATVLAALVASHWFLDAIVHAPDLPLYPGSATLAGMGAWSSLPLTLAIELAVFGGGAWLYAARTRAADATGRWAFAGLVLFLLAIHAGNLLGPPPPSATAIAWVGQAQWLLVLWAFWADNHRAPVPAPAGP
ncbi:MAG: hypothetical protein KJ007_15665 [Burkholderiales bacterium]|nr:hypothetical protein [Burkholderiales bacterium]